MKSASSAQVAWAAGIFEGEGCVFRRKGRSTVQASVTMTDRDRIELLHKILGVGTVIEVKPQKAHWKPAWKWSTASHDGVRHVGEMLYPWLGPRRRAAFEEAASVAHSGRADRIDECPNCGHRTTPGPMALHRKRCDHQ